MMGCRAMALSHRRIAGLALALLGLVLLAQVFALSHRTALARLEVEAGVSARVRAMALEAELAKQRAVVAILADDALVAEVLANPGETDLVSRKLDRLRDETQGAVIYLLDRTGTALAASNWDAPDSFVGADYSFRRYFTDALRATTAQQFALGTVSHKPGLYLSHSVLRGADVLGVVVVKVEFDALEAAWADGAGATHVTDEEGRVVLSSTPGLRFGAMPAPGAGQLASVAELPSIGWRLTVFAPTAPAQQAAMLATLAVALVLAALAGGAGFVLRGKARAEAREQAERRYRADLEREVALRTQELSAEMGERVAAEARLAALQADLVQANKLAALGQIAAGVAHEVNQPLATIRLLSENARHMLPADAPPDVSGNLGSILRMTDRIGRITTELRSFSRKARGLVEPTSLLDAFEASLLLTASRMRRAPVRIIRPEIPPDLRVMAEAVRLEQVLVNLLQNAHEALDSRPDPEIRIEMALADDRVTLTVSDNGPGLAPEVAGQLFIPFATTKEQGVGLGLVIARDIARDFGGSLSADPSIEGQGACFRLELRRA